jgi:hypothetical protein
MPDLPAGTPIVPLALPINVVVEERDFRRVVAIALDAGEMLYLTVPEARSGTATPDGPPEWISQSQVLKAYAV